MSVVFGYCVGDVTGQAPCCDAPANASQIDAHLLDPNQNQIDKRIGLETIEIRSLNRARIG
jgi:hypothetical protein